MENTISPEEVKSWLKNIGQTRLWLADQLGVAKSTVDNWLSRDKFVPETKAGAIRSLMVGRNTYSSVIAVPVRFTVEEWAEVKRQLGVSTIEEAEPALRAFALERARVTIYAVTHPGDLGAAEAPPPPRP